MRMGGGAAKYRAASHRQRDLGELREQKAERRSLFGAAALRLT